MALLDIARRCRADKCEVTSHKTCPDEDERKQAAQGCKGKRHR